MSESTETSGSNSDPGVLRRFQQWCSRPAESRWGRFAQLAIFLFLCFWLVRIIFDILNAHGLADAYLKLAAGLSAIWILNNAGKTWELFVDFSRFLDSGRNFDAFKAVPKVVVPAFVAFALYSYIVGALHDRTDPNSMAGKILAPFESFRVYMTSDREPLTEDEIKRAVAEALAGHSSRLQPILVQIDNNEAVLVPLSSIEERLDAQKLAIEALAVKLERFQPGAAAPASRLILLDMADSDEGPSLVHNAVFPVRFGDATLATYPPSDSFSIDDVTWEKGPASGLALTQSQNDDLELLTDMLRLCMGDKPVIFAVSGHASSLPFRHYGPGDISDALNLEAARFRREAVISRLTELKDNYISSDIGFRPKSFLINPVQRASIDESNSSAPFDDTPGGVSSNKKNPARLLNQAVFIQFESVGDCERS